MRPPVPGIAALLSSLLVGCAGDDAGPVPGADVTVFEGARVLTGEAGPPLEDAILVVEGERFVRVGRRGEVEVPPGARRVDLSGKTVMPVILNAHMHLAQSREALVQQLEHLAYYGVGTAASLGSDSSDVIFRIRDDPVPGAARLLTAGRGITRPEPGRGEAPYWIDTQEEARAAVRELAERRVDLVKIWVDDRGGQYEKLTPELYGAVIDEAHRYGLRVTAHIFSLEDAKGLLTAGIDAFAHGIRDRDVDDELVALWRDRPHVVLVPNLPDPGVARDLGWLRETVAPDRLAELQRVAVHRPEARPGFEIQARNLARLDREGIAIAFGTDGSAPWSAHEEMADMVRAGMSPAEVIVAATSGSADLLRLDGLGKVATGATADFVVLDADPTSDILNTRRIHAVYLRGAAVDREAVSERLLSGVEVTAQARSRRNG